VFYPTLVSDYHRLQFGAPIAMVGATTISVYVKQIGSDYRVGINATGYVAASVIFSLVGAGSVIGAVGGTAPNRAATITKVTDDGWYRITLTGTYTSLSSVYVFMASSTATDPTGLNFIGVEAQGVAIWGLQINPGSTAQTYYPTTTAAYHAPRFDYSPTTIGEPRGLLIEGQATNLARFSENCGNTANGWWSLTGAGSTLNSQTKTSPANTSTASEISFGTSTNSNTYVYVGTSAITYTGSIYVRLVSGNPAINIRVYNSTTGIATFTPITVTSTWAKYSVSFTGGASFVEFGVQSPHATTVVVDVWGAQVEVGSGASSYIPTGASGVTRNADGVVMSDISSLSFNQSKGTIYSQLEIRERDRDTFPAYGVFNASAGSRCWWFMRHNHSNASGQRILGNAFNTANTSIINGSSLSHPQTGVFRFATSLDTSASRMVYVANGESPDINTAASFTLATAVEMSINKNPDLAATELGSMWLQTLKYFPTALSDTQLKTITNPTYVAPTLDLDFVPMTTGADLTNKGITFTRLSNATFINSSGYVDHAGANLLLYSAYADTNWIPYGTYAKAYTTGITSPIGDTTAARITFNNVTNGLYYNSASLGSPNIVGATYTMSAWIRATDTTANPAIRFGDSGVAAGANIPITTTWTRYSYTYNNAVSASSPLIQSASGTATGQFEMWGFQLNPGSTAQTYYPTTTAAYYAPRFDSSILTSRTNLILQSNNFTIAGGTPWAQKNGTHSVTLTADTAPPGFSGTATKLTASNVNAGIIQALSVPAISGKTARISFYAKSNALTEQTCFLQQASSLLSAVTIPTTWTRIDLSVGTNAITEITLKGFIDPLDISIYGMQVEYVTSGGATDYIPTTTASVTVNTTEPKGLLIEGATTNLCTYSNDFNNANWTRDGVANGALDPVVTPLYPSTGPDGALTVTRIVFDKINGASGVNGIFSRIRRTILSVPSNTYTMSVWMKANIANGAAGIQNVGLRMGSSAGVNCVVTTTWQRFTHTFAVTDGSAEFQIMLWDNITGPPVNSETADILVYGAQTELGFGASSYIPTGSTSTVLRVADHCTIPTSSFISGKPYPQTLFVDCIPNTPSGAFLDIARIFDRTAGGAFSYGTEIYYYTASTMTISRKIAASTNTERNFASGLAYGTRHKLALSIDASSFSGSYDGVTSLGVATAPTALASVATHLGVGCSGDSAPNAVMFGTIRQIKFYPTALTQTQINALTVL
jgi:hypothetical protein